MVGSHLCKRQAKSENFGRELDRSVAVFGPGVIMLLNDDADFQTLGHWFTRIKGSFSGFAEFPRVKFLDLIRFLFRPSLIQHVLPLVLYKLEALNPFCAVFNGLNPIP